MGSTLTSLPVTPVHDLPALRPRILLPFVLVTLSVAAAASAAVLWTLRRFGVDLERGAPEPALAWQTDESVTPELFERLRGVTPLCSHVAIPARPAARVDGMRRAG